MSLSKTWKNSPVPLTCKEPTLPGADALVLMPAQSTAQPTPYRVAQLDWGLLPESVPQSQVPPTWTPTVPLCTVKEPSALCTIVPLATAVPFESGSGLAALAKATPADPPTTASTTARAVPALATPLRRPHRCDLHELRFASVTPVCCPPSTVVSSPLVPYPRESCSRKPGRMSQTGRAARYSPRPAFARTLVLRGRGREKR